MASFWSRLGSLLRRQPKSSPSGAVSVDDHAQVAPGQPHEAETRTPANATKPARAPRARAPRAVPQEVKAAPLPTSLRIGVDFGTSTTQVAVYLEGREPQLIRLEDATDHMPSYYAKEPDGTNRFGAVAQNLPENVHSIKPKLVQDEEIPGFGHPSQITFLMLEEVVRRTIQQLRAQQLIPAEMDLLEVATNLGCTPRFELDTRSLLRDMAQRAGLQVGLATLIEEPVAAAYEIMLSGMVSDGRILVIDMGGGTLDIAVIKISDAARTFELFASGGYEHAGDAFTKVIERRLIDATIGPEGAVSLTRADETLIWQRAEAAKQSLSVRRSAIVPLGGIAGHADETIEVTDEWFVNATRNLRVVVEHDVKTVYQMARLVLDRGGEFDPAPGTIDFDEPTKGRVRRLTEVGLRDDALEHIDTVVLVGGGTNMPMIDSLFKEIFGERVIQPEIVGIDRSAIVALGLSRPKPPGMANLRYPSWGVSALFATGNGEQEIPLYEPFAPTFHVHRGVTSVYSHAFVVPTDAHSVALVFRPVGGSGTRWPSIRLRPEIDRLTFQMDLFGAIRVLTPADEDLLGSLPERPQAPWSPSESDTVAAWLPPWRKPEWWVDVPTWDLRNDM